MKVGRYEILDELGKGAMGVVYKARDPNLDLLVALKVLRPERLSDPALVRRFLAEARALGRLDHPNTVRVFNVDQDGGRTYIAMEYVEGESLGERMKRSRLSLPETAGLGARVAEALGDAHRKGIVHRDVKPGNILIRSDGRIKITDFGIAHVEDLAQDDRTQAGEILGTPGYMSPEQVAGRPVDGRSDVFSLGIILYELATGKKPFAANTLAATFYAITHGEPAAPAEVNPEVPGPLQEVILRCLRKNPEERFPTGEALAEALRAAVGEPDPSAGAPPAEEPAARRRNLALAAVLAAALAAAGAAYYLWPSAPATVGTAVAPSPAPPEHAADARLAVDSVPKGARLFVAGALRGTTPLTLPLPAGKHEVRVTLPGYLDWEAQVQLTQNQETPLSVELVPAEPERR